MDFLQECKPGYPAALRSLIAHAPSIRTGRQTIGMRLFSPLENTSAKRNGPCEERVERLFATGAISSPFSLPQAFVHFQWQSMATAARLRQENVVANQSRRGGRGRQESRLLKITRTPLSLLVKPRVCPPPSVPFAPVLVFSKETWL